MKQKHSIEGQSGFWVKLIGVLVAVGIVVVLVFGGIQSVTSQMNELQRQLDKKSIEFNLVSGQLDEANRELGAKSSELKTTQVELDQKVKELEQAQSDAAKMSVALEESRSQLEVKAAQMSETENDLKSTQSRFEANVSELEDAKGELVNLYGELATAASKLAKRDRELSEKADAFASAESQLNAVTSELEVTAVQLEQSQNQIEKRDDELSILLEELSVAKSDLATAQGELASKSSELTQARDDISETASKLVAWQSKYYMKLSELNRAQDDISETAAELVALRSKFLQKSSQLRTTQLKLTYTVRELEETEAELSAGPASASQRVMERLIELLPDTLTAGEEEWKRNFDEGIEGIKNIRGVRRPAAGKEIYYYTQQGSKMSLNFAVFPDEEGAIAEFERKQRLRSSLVNLAENAALRKPNLLGSGLYGSFALFQIDNYFVEVLVEIFTRGDPLETLTHETLRFFENNRSDFEAASGTLEITQRELEAKVSELDAASAELARAQTELQVAYNLSAEIQTEFAAHLAVQELYNCYTYELVGLITHVLDNKRPFSADQRTRYAKYADFLLDSFDGSESVNPIAEFCISTDWFKDLVMEASERASHHAENTLNVSSVDRLEMFVSFYRNGIGTPENISERIAELSADFHINAEEEVLRMLGSNVFDLLADALVGYRTSQ